MKEPANSALLAIARQLGPALADMLAIHNDVFQVKPARMVPRAMGGEPVDFHGHVIRLKVIEESIEEVRTLIVERLPTIDPDVEAVIEYTEQLAAACRQFRSLNVALDLKARGARDLSLNEYNMLLKEYERRVKVYQHKGQALDVMFRRRQATLG